MNLLLHGATDLGSSNYGDFLYAYLIYSYFKEKYQYDEINFYKPSKFYNKYLKLKLVNKIEWSKYDYAIYIPGGYFGESHNASFLANIIHFYRFMIFGLKAVFHNKKLIVLAIGAGPIDSLLLKLPIKIILRNSSLVTVRDHDSYLALKNLNFNANVIEASDLIIAQNLNFKINNDTFIEKLNIIGKKILLVHYNNSKEAMIKFAESVKKFVEKNNDYQIVVTSDCCFDDEKLFEEFKSIVGKELFFYKYNSPFELTELLSKVDLVLTCKLHLGVVSCMLKKSVIVAAVHPGKTKRFYRDIGEEYRCVSLFETSSDNIEKMLTRYKDSKINIPKEMVEKANITWRLLDEFFKK